ncbi:MAG: hypothetical protein ACOC8H_00675, partial [bacterium]
VLSEAAELGEIDPDLMAKDALPSLWNGDEIEVKAVLEYFNGDNVVQVDRGAYQEPQHIPKADKEVVFEAISAAVETGSVWLTSGPASLLAEPVPPGVLTESAVMRVPPEPILATSILPEPLPEAWEGDVATALAVATALSQKEGATLPWKTVRDGIDAAIRARFVETTAESGQWPCEYSQAQTVKLRVAPAGTGATTGAGKAGEGASVLVASSELEPSEVQDLGELVPQLLDVKAKTNVPMKFHVRIDVGDGKEPPDQGAVTKLNQILSALKEQLRLQ